MPIMIFSLVSNLSPFINTQEQFIIDYDGVHTVYEKCQNIMFLLKNVPRTSSQNTFLQGSEVPIFKKTFI